MPLVDFGLAACFARIGIGWIMDGDADPVALGSRALATRRVYLFHYLPLSFLWGRRSSTDANNESTMDWSFLRKPLLVGGKGGEHRPSLLDFRWRQDAGLAYPHQDHNIDMSKIRWSPICAKFTKIINIDRNLIFKFEMDGYGMTQICQYCR
jgi:hypothetical protein